MRPHTLSFNCALITGGAGGLGRAMAETLISRGKKVIIAGRTESKLASAAKELGHDTAYYVLDTGDVSAIAPFIKRVTAAHPEIDCLINNAGVQRPLSIDDFDLQKADQEIAINISGPMHLSVGFLGHFKKEHAERGGVIMNVSSVLGFVPFSVINPVYNGTKAFVHFWTMNLRSQLARSGANVKVVEIVPPTVETDLHREREDPDDNKKGKNAKALSVDEFMRDVVEGWEEDADVVAAGMARDVVKDWEGQFMGMYDVMAK